MPRDAAIAEEARSSTIAVALIVQDEEDRIGDALRSVSWADEVVVVDSGSTDRTREIAESLGARVEEHDWPGFVEQREYAMARCRSAWIMMIDADERVTAGLASELRQAIASAPPELVGFWVRRRNSYLGRFIWHSGWYPEYRLRVIRAGRGRWETGKGVHEHLIADGDTRRLRGELLHHPYRSFSEHLRVIDKYSSTAAREMHARGRRAGLLHVTLRPCGAFLKKYLFRAGFLDGLPGFVIGVTTAFSVFCKYMKLIEMQRAEGLDRTAENQPGGGPRG